MWSPLRRMIKSQKDRELFTIFRANIWKKNAQPSLIILKNDNASTIMLTEAILSNYCNILFKFTLFGYIKVFRS